MNYDVILLLCFLILRMYGLSHSSQKNSSANSKSTDLNQPIIFELPEISKPAQSLQRRGVNVDIHLSQPKPAIKGDTIDDLLEDVLKNIAKLSPKKKTQQELDRTLSTDCPECSFKEAQTFFRRKILLLPAYPCDEWDRKSRICWLDRNVGDTVTFVLSLGNDREFTHLWNKIIWKQEFYSIKSRSRKEMIINPEKLMWNMAVGSQGRELRISPITESDLDLNGFSAIVVNQDKRNGDGQPVSPFTAVRFRIRKVPIDLGFLYLGESLVLNVRSYISLPRESMFFQWYFEDGEFSNLPSNMKCGSSCATLIISELRKEEEGILSCAVYTSSGFFATKQRFLIKDINKNGEVLNSNFSEVALHTDREKLTVRHKRNVQDNNYQQYASEQLNRDLNVASKTFTGNRELMPEQIRGLQNGEMAFKYPVNKISDQEEEEEFNPAGRNSQRLYEIPQSENFNNHPRYLQPEPELSQNQDPRADNKHTFINHDQMAAIQGKELQNGEVDSTYLPKYTSNKFRIDDERIPQKLYEFPQNENFNSESMGNQGVKIKDTFRNQEQLSSIWGNDFSNEEAYSRYNFSRYPMKKISVKEENNIDEINNQNEQLKLLGVRGPVIKLDIDREKLDFDERLDSKQLDPEEYVANIISKCNKNADCSNYATCIKRERQVRFCKCQPNFHGNGIFCWEDVHVRS